MRARTGQNPARAARTSLQHAAAPGRGQPRASAIAWRSGATTPPEAITVRPCIAPRRPPPFAQLANTVRPWASSSLSLLEQTLNSPPWCQHTRQTVPTARVRADQGSASRPARRAFRIQHHLTSPPRRFNQPAEQDAPMKLIRTHCHIQLGRRHGQQLTGGCTPSICAQPRTANGDQPATDPQSARPKECGPVPSRHRVMTTGMPVIELAPALGQAQVKISVSEVMASLHWAPVRSVVRQDTSARRASANRSRVFN